MPNPITPGLRRFAASLLAAILAAACGAEQGDLARERAELQQSAREELTRLEERIEALAELTGAAAADSLQELELRAERAARHIESLGDAGRRQLQETRQEIEHALSELEKAVGEAAEELGF